tara:strand:+ start:7901 stop:12130 length:4230 start_codon:yes stop_codon:yes gene_type:complete
MTNDPYEETVNEFAALDEQLQEFNQVQDTPSDSEVEDPMLQQALESSTSQPQPQPEQPQESQKETGRISGIADKEFIKTKVQELRQWRSMPDGPEKEAAKRAWNIKYHGKEDPNFFQRYVSDTRRIAPMEESFFGVKIPNVSGMAGPAAALGLIDTFTDTANLIPGVNIPKLGEFESSAMNGVRDISGLILPMRMLKGAAVIKATKLQKAGVAPKVVQKLGRDPLFRWFSEVGLDIGTGVAVDYVVEQNQRDDNVTGMAKQAFPKFFQWIPDSIATNDTDSPSQKRTKNVREGALIGAFSNFTEGFIKLYKADSSLKTGTNFLPKNSLAEANLQNSIGDEFSDMRFDDDPVTDHILRAKARDQKALDDLGKHYLAEDPTYSSPKIGRDDVFDANETAVRPRDPDGVPGVAVDAARIADNIDTGYGRLGAIQSESDLVKSLSPEALANRNATKAVAKTIKEMGKFDAALPSGKVVSNDQIENAGVRLAEIINDPRMIPGELKLMLDEFKSVTKNGLKKLDKVGSRAVNKSITKLTDEFFDMDVEKARAYLVTSNAGQISDISEGARLMEGTTAVARAQDRILDRLEYLLVEKKLATAQNGLRRSHLNAYKQAVQTGDINIIGDTVDSIKDQIDEKLLTIIPNTKKYINGLRSIAEERPEFLKTFRMAQELVDGDVDSLYKIHTWAENKLGTFSKVFYDQNPEQASILVRSKSAVIFNSILSSLATPIKALYGNVGGIIGKPVSIFTGALLNGDLKTLRRSWHQYAGFWDSMQKGFQHMKVVYRKAATDPTAVSYIMRDDIAIKEVKELEVLKSYAEAMEANGQSGANILLSIWEENDKLARHPWLRFGSNAMTALDGFNRAMYATAEAKGRAFDAIMEGGHTFNKETLNKASNDIYANFFDKNGMITDSAVDYATREAALNLDSNLVNGINTVVARVPLLRSILMFPKTQANALDIFRKWSGAGAIPHIGHKFEADYWDFTKKDFNLMAPEEVDNLLRSKGIDPTINREMDFRTKAAEFKGRAAIGMTTGITASMLALNGRIRGNGHWDTETQLSRVKDLNWKKKTIQGWDGKWYSYEFLGPIGDIISFHADLVDNFDSLSTSTFEKMHYKLGFILGASLTDRSALASLEPLQDIFQANPSALHRWAANFGNSWMPFAGLRRDMTKLISPMQKEYENNVGDLIRMRNSFIDPLDPQGALPTKYNFITGKQIGRPENMWVRINNTYNEMKIHEDQTPEQDFLLEIEYDARPIFNQSSGGTKYTPTQKAALYSKVGEQGTFNHELKEIMKDAKNLTYTDDSGTTYTGFINVMRALRRDGVSSDEINTAKYARIVTRIDKALSRAKENAEIALRGTSDFIHLDSADTLIEEREALLESGQLGEAINIDERYNATPHTSEADQKALQEFFKKTR